MANENTIQLSKAKEAISATSADDKEFSSSFLEAKKLEHESETTKENNRHAKAMLGWFGVVFGHEKCASVYIAFTVALLSILIASGCLLAAYTKETNSEAWFKQTERAFAFALASISFIFGRSNVFNNDDK